MRGCERGSHGRAGQRSGEHIRQTAWLACPAQDFGYDALSGKLIYACNTLAADNITLDANGNPVAAQGGDGNAAARRLLGEEAQGSHAGHGHSHHGHGHDHHHHGMGRRMLTSELPLLDPGHERRRAANQRALLQLDEQQALVTATMPDPTSYPTNAAGLPLLHSRESATRKIFLDFDGHTARLGPQQKPGLVLESSAP